MRSESAVRMWPRHTASSRALFLLAAAAAAAAAALSSSPLAGPGAGAGGGSSKRTYATPTVWRRRSIDSFHRRYPSAPLSGLTLTFVAAAAIALDQTENLAETNQSRRGVSKQ
uniref:CASP-like protein n=1 Tax=Oryza nivara TaxID=4536 RepID=A0A0E0IBZ0_ORYNI